MINTMSPSGSTIQMVTELVRNGLKTFLMSRRLTNSNWLGWIWQGKELISRPEINLIILLKKYIDIQRLIRYTGLIYYEYFG